MRVRSLMAATCLALAMAACNKAEKKAEAPAAPAAAPEAIPTLAPRISDLKIAPDQTIKDIMDNHVDPAGDFMFAAIMDVADEKGLHRHEPRTDADWADVRQNLIVLHDAPTFMAEEGRKGARPTDRSKFPELELEPEDVDKLLVAKRASFVRHAKKLQDVAADGLKAADAKDTKALYSVIDRIDVACESCHLNFWYPNDERAKAAAKRRGVLDE
jgi:hypothetical protein